jgi:3-deoxy-D-manno-octulosonate 8-phosphate phosphatase (KDO 8-P phosphatase)
MRVRSAWRAASPVFDAGEPVTIATMSELPPALANVRLAVFDFDGVFTDNRVWVTERGEEALAFSRSDGLGLRRLDEVGVEYVIVSMESNPIVGARAQKLRADCVQGVDDKLAVVRERSAGLGVSLEQTAFVGNDINDAECLSAVGIAVVPADAWPEVKPLAKWVLSRAGGAGCVREFCDAVWQAQRS